MVDDSVVVSVYIFEEGGNPLDLLAVLPQHVFKCEVFEVSRRNVAFLHVLLFDPAEDNVDNFSFIAADQQDLLRLMNGY